METRLIKIRIESDNEEDLRDAFHQAVESLEDQPWRSKKTKIRHAWVTKEE